MSLQLNHTQIRLGLTDELDSALNVDLIPVAMPIMTHSTGEQFQGAFCDIDSDNKPQRIIALLKPLIDKALAENNIDFTITPVFWLLPELAIEDKQPLIDWASLLKQHYPALFVQANTQFFPFGSSAIVMALKAAEHLLKSQSIKQVCLISADSWYHQLDKLHADKVCLTAHRSEGLIPSEGAAMTCISLADHGLNLLGAVSESATALQVTQIIESLFYSAAKQLKIQAKDTLISTFYTPSNGVAKQTTPWVEGYRRLAGHVNQKTQLKQLPQLTGDIGCVTGLYHFLHIYSAYQQQIIIGNTLQLELSERLYQGVNLYSWTGKDVR